MEDQEAKAISDAVDQDAKGMARMLGPLPDTETQSNDQELVNWMWRDPNVDVAELQQGVAMNAITPQMAKAIQFQVQNGYLDPEEASKLTPKDAGMLAMHPRRLVLMRTGRPDPEMQIRYSDRMSAMERKHLEESAIPLPEGMLNGGSVDTRPAIVPGAGGAQLAAPGMLAEGGVPQPVTGGAGSP